MKPLLIFRLLLTLVLGLAVLDPTQSVADEQAGRPAAAVASEPSTVATPPAAVPATSPAPPAPAPAAPRQREPATTVAPAAPATPVAPKAPAPVPAAVAPTGPSDLVRRRCKIAGAVLLGLTGATVVAFFGSVIYIAAATPDAVSLPAGPRLGFGLSALALGIGGSALLGYSLNAPGRPAPPRTPAPSAPTGRVAALEFQF